jgi:prepilin-type processing-associated H-X9-DG protein
MKYLLSFLAWLTVGYLGSGSTAWAQEATPPERFGDIPKDSVSVFSLEFAKMRSSKDFELWPWEVLEVVAKEQFGVSLESIEAIDGMVLMPSPEPEFGISIRTKEPFDIARLPEQMFSPIGSSPKDESLKFRDLVEAPMMRLMQREPTRVILGTPGALRRMTSSRLQPGGPFVQMVQQSPAILRLAVNLETLRDLISAFALADENQIPEEIFHDIEQTIDLTDNAMVELFPDPNTAMQLSLGTSGPDKTELLNKSLLRIRQAFLGMVSDAMLQDMEQGPSVSDQMNQAIKSYAARVRKVIDSESFWEVQDQRLVIKVEKNMGASYQVIGVMAGMLLPAVQSAREAARRMESSNNLKQMALALHNYHDAYTKLPAQAIVDPDGTPLLSWRVAILPFLGENELYQQFHLDEPWDSQHNIQLLDRMPDFYRNRSNPPVSGMTTYLTPIGQGVGLGPKGLKFRQLTDGTSNTLAIVDVDPELGVPWTKPDDLDITQQDALVWLRPEGSNAAFFDGSVRFLSPSIDLEILEALMTYAGGEAIPMIP